ncbi:MAG: phage tail tube protein [Candidatus Brocadiales bacterium]
MAQARGNSTKISYVEEGSFGVTPPSPEMRLMPFTSEELSVKGDAFIQVKDGSERVSTSAGSGYMDAGGRMALDIELDSIGTLLKHGLGDSVTTGSSTPFTHVIRGGSGLPPGLSIEKGFSDVGQFMLFKGCRIDTLSLDFPGDGGTVSGTLDILSKAAVTGSTSVASSLLEVAGAPISYQVSIEDGATTLENILGLQLVIRNHLDRDGFVLGSRERHSISEGLRRISGALTLEFEDFSYYERFSDITSSALKITTLQGGFSMEIFLPKIVFTGSAPVPAVRDAGPLAGLLHFVALNDPSEGTDIKITLINNQSVI